MAFIPGLVSITFRKLSPAEIVDAVKQAGLQAIEWGSDVHVPAGELAVARQVKQMTLDAGLEVSAYGSYYRVGVPESDDFDKVLASAVELGAPYIRIWTGNQHSADVDAAQRSAIVEEIQRNASLAQEQGVQIGFEYHSKTLTDTDESALKLLQEVDHDNVFTFWQPHNLVDGDTNIAGLKAVLGWVQSVHVFHWGSGHKEQWPLADGRDDWSRYLEVVASTGRDHHAMLEFVKDDTLDQFYEDAATLKAWIGESG